jgi:hypothetical protein
MPRPKRSYTWGEFAYRHFLARPVGVFVRIFIVLPFLLALVALAHTGLGDATGYIFFGSIVALSVYCWRDL